jgi:O-antigen/teichoic acid export membrane protein
MTILARFRWFLAPTVAQAAVSFAMLPIVTRILGPADYGAFALAIAIVTLGVTVACLGSSYALAEGFSQQDEARRKAIVAGQAAASTLLGVLFAAAFYLLYAPAARALPAIAEIGPVAAGMAAASVVGTVLWAVATEVVTLDGRAKLFAAVIISQTLVTAAVTLAALFWAGAGRLALFAGHFAGSAVLICGAAIALRRYWTADLVGWLRGGGLRGSLGRSAGNVVESVYSVLERNMLAIFASVHEVGLYVHSQQYRVAAGAGVKAIARSIWPVSLGEAMSAAGGFPNTRRAWGATHVLITAAGVGFAAIGPEIISLLTNDKFTAAWPLAALGMAYLLALNAGKPQTAYLLARGQGTELARLHVYATVTAMLIALATIPRFGMWGALAAALAQQVSLRLLIQWYVRGARLPMQDAYVAIGFMVILILVGANLSLALPLYARLLETLVVLTALAAWTGAASQVLGILRRANG